MMRSPLRAAVRGAAAPSCTGEESGSGMSVFDDLEVSRTSGVGVFDRSSVDPFIGVFLISAKKVELPVLRLDGGCAPTPAQHGQVHPLCRDEENPNERIDGRAIEHPHSTRP